MFTLHQIPSEAKIKKDLKVLLFGKRLFCPRCGSYQVRRSKKRYHCKKCRKPFSLTSVTWLKGIKLSLSTFYILLWCWCNKVPVDQTMRLSKVSEPTVRRWFNKFRKPLPDNYQMRLSGIIQMDEAFYGSKKSSLFIAAKEKGTRKVVGKVLSHTNLQRQDIIPILQQHVVPGSQLNTDGHGVYRGIANWWPVNHQYDVHSRFEFSLTSEIEGLFGNFKTFIRRMYHHVTKEKLPELVGEFLARFSHPEYFQSPQNYLKVAILPLVRPNKKAVQKRVQNLHSLTDLKQVQNPLTSVPY